MSATSAVYQKPPTAEQSFLLTPNPAFHCVSMCKIRTPLHLAGRLFIVEQPLQFAENLRWTALNIFNPIPMSNFVT